MQKEVEKHFTRGEIRRVRGSGRRRDLVPGARPRRLRKRPARHARRRGDPCAPFPPLVDYGFSASSVRSAARARAARRRNSRGARVPEPRGEGDKRARHLDRAGEATRRRGRRGSRRRLRPLRCAPATLIDGRAREIPVEQALLLYLRLIGSNGGRGKLAFPAHRDEPGRPADRGLRPWRSCGRRRPSRRSPRPRRRTAWSSQARLVAAMSSPNFLPGYDAVASLANLLELLAPVKRPISELVAELPRPHARAPPASRARGG